MADDVTLDAGSGGDTIAADDIGGVKHQRVKIEYGTDGSATEVSDSNPLPVDDAGGSLTVDDGGTSLTVDGTVAATQSGTWTVQPGNTANTTAWKVDGSAVTQPVSGTVTANLSATDNAVLDNIDADTSAIQTAVEAIQTAVEGTLTVTGGGGGTEYTVDAVAPAAPVGATFVMERDDALSALTEVEGDWTNPRANANGALWVKHDGTVTVDGSGVTQPVSGTVTVQDGGGAITVDNAGTFAVQADTELTTADLDTGAGTDTRAVVGLAGTASGGAQLIPGSSTDGLLVNLGANNDVTVTGTVTANAGSGPFPVSDNGGSLTVDNGGTFAVQAAQSGTWTVQPGNTANTTAWKVDASSVAVPITDNSGSLTVDNAGTFAVQDSQVVTDNAAFTDGTTKVQPVGYVFDEVAGTALTENDAAAARIDSKRAQIGVLEDATTRGQRAAVSAAGALKVDGSAVTQPVSDGGGALTVDNAGTFAVQAAQSGTWTVQPGNTANTTAWKVDGSAVTQPVSYATTGSGTATGALRVELPTNGTGTLATVSTVTTCSTLTGGGVAHDGADSGNPVKVGAKAGTSDITAVANGDRTDLRSDTLGHVIVRPYALHENLVTGSTAAITDTTSTSVIASAGAGVRNYITALTVTNSHASVGTLVTIKDGSGGSTLWEGYCASAGGGYAISFPAPLRGSAATAVHAVCGTTGANVYVSASGYKSAV